MGHNCFYTSIVLTISKLVRSRKTSVEGSSLLVIWDVPARMSLSLGEKAISVPSNLAGKFSRTLCTSFVFRKSQTLT